MAPSSSTLERSAQGQFVARLSKLPWWLLLIMLAGVFLLYKFTTDELYSFILGKLKQGILVTIFVTTVAYAAAIVIGLIAGLGRVSKNPAIFNLATLYVQIIRGVPILVQIFYITFVVTPALFAAVNWVGNGLASPLGLRPMLDYLATANPQQITAALNDLNGFQRSVVWLAQVDAQSLSFLTRVIFALAVAYGGFEAETFRAGIESIGKGQMEAARSLGMSYVQAMQHIILPQAVRRVLPPLGNDFISMLKDSSLVSVLGVRDVTQEARVYAAVSFRYPETLNSLAFVYLSMTVVLSLGVKWLESRMEHGRSG
jgi:polar amino acid transport system permease protein